MEAGFSVDGVEGVRCIDQESCFCFWILENFSHRVDCCFASTFHSTANLEGPCCFLYVFAQDIPNGFGADSSDGFANSDRSDVICSFFKWHKTTCNKCCECFRINKFCAESLGEFCHCFTELLTSFLRSVGAGKTTPVICIKS